MVADDLAGAPHFHYVSWLVPTESADPVPVPRTRITVVFLLYRAEREAPELVSGLLVQRHPEIGRQGDWLAAIFMDDASGDGTARAVGAALEAAGSPPHCRLVVNERNLGLAATLNKAFGLVETPFVLTCHLDCRFGCDDYAAEMLRLLETHPKVAAITGRPAVRDPRALPFAEKLNLVANLQDVLPVPPGPELVPVGFAEGRCDGFRLEALREVGFYDATLRTAGEDQVLAAKLRTRGYEVCQAPHLPYFLSVSSEQDTVWRLARHQWLFGRAHPYILLHTRGTDAGVASGSAGSNRRARALLRLLQVASTATLVGVLLALALGRPLIALGLLALVAAAKATLFARHLRFIRLSAREHLTFWLAQPMLDAAYTIGLVQGIVRALRGAEGRPIG